MRVRLKARKRIIGLGHAAGLHRLLLPDNFHGNSIGNPDLSGYSRDHKPKKGRGHPQNLSCLPPSKMAS